MTTRTLGKIAGAAVVLAGILGTGMLSISRKAYGQYAPDQDGIDGSEVLVGFAIAPVPLNLAGKDRALVGLGSYLVNAVASCNDCHNPGPGGASGYLPNGNPFLLPPPAGPYGGRKLTNPATYLGGGRDFGPLPADPFAHIISRNLTPDKTGRPAGGHSLVEFFTIMRTGVDMDHLHPTCTGAPGPACIPAPFDGSRLQIMAWPTYKDMTDRDLTAIYEYLSAIPCIGGPPAPDPRHNDCH